jgi:hypothetical protein
MLSASPRSGRGQSSTARLAVAMLVGVLALGGCQFRAEDHPTARAAAVAQQRCSDGSTFECITLAVPAVPDVPGHHRAHDVVLFDQRGVGRSEPIRCDTALAEDHTGALTSSSPTADRDAFAAAAGEFSARCFAEAGVAQDTAPRYSTREAVEDSRRSATG